MEEVRLQYKCKRCGSQFHVDSRLSPKQVQQAMDSYLYGIDSFHNVAEYATHKCTFMPDAYDPYRGFISSTKEVIGIGELVGYSVTELPHNKQKSPLSLVTDAE